MFPSSRGSFNLFRSTTSQPTLQPTLSAVGTNRTVDSDGTLRAGTTTDIRSAPIVAPLLGADVDTDFGLVPRFSVGDFVWLDANGERRRPVVDDVAKRD